MDKAAFEVCWVIWVTRGYSRRHARNRNVSCGLAWRRRSSQPRCRLDQKCPPTPMRAASALPGRWSCSVSGICPLQRRLLRLVFFEGWRVPSRLLARNWNSTASLGLVTLGTLRDKAEEHALWHTSRASARRYATRPTRGFVAARARVNEQILSPRPVSIAAGVSDVQKSTCTLLMRPTQQ